MGFPHWLGDSPRCPQTYTIAPMVFPYQSSEIPVTLKAGQNALVGSHSLLKLTLLTLHSASCHTLLEVPSDWNTFCWCIDKIIGRDLRLVASQLYGNAITQPQVVCCHYIVPLCWCRPPGLHNQYKGKGKIEGTESLTILPRTCSDEPTCCTSDSYWSRWSFGGPGKQQNCTSIWLWSRCGRNLCQCHLDWA